VSTSDHAPTFTEVRLRGRLAGVTCVALPSGDEAVTFRVVVDRPAERRAGVSARSRVDAIECIAWSAGLRRRLPTWDEGVIVEVEGGLRRRFWRSGAGVASRTEVQAVSVRRLR
jgi:single-strand DNA-binding protein